MVLGIVLWTAGCGSGVGQVSSPIKPGIYSGQATCTSSDPFGGGTTTEDAPSIVTIGPTGLPIVDGREVVVGPADLGGLLELAGPIVGATQVSGSVLDVVVSPDGVVITSTVTITIPGGSVTMLSTDVWRVLGENAIEQELVLILTAEVEGDSFVGITSCSGVLTR